MEMKYTKEFTVTNNMLTKSDYIKNSSILDIAQEIAGEHAISLHLGYDDLIKENLLWVVVRNYVEIYKPIKDIRKVLVNTYPLAPRFVEYNRDTEFFIDGNEPLLKMRSTWMIINKDTFNIETPPIFKNMELSKGLFSSRIKRLPQIDKSLLTYDHDFKVTYSYLDHNGHMNNARYLDLFLDTYKEEGKFTKTFQVEYVKQCFLDEVISLYKYEEDEKYYLYGYGDNGLKFYLVVTFFKEDELYEN